jgi:O-antigen/teichoic acid export membrane protein
MAIGSAITGIAFPLLSGMKDGRKKAAWRAVRLSMVFSIPLTIAIITYPRVVLGLFGEEYASADLTLIVLLLSTIPLTISTGIHTLAYAYGNYRQVLIIGLAGNMPSVLLYFFLTPPLGGLGASYAYLTGALTGVTASVIMAHKIKMKIIWLDLAKAISIPLALGILAYTANLHWLIGGPIIISASLLGYAKLNLITKQDLRDLAEAIIPKKLTESIYQRFAWILNVLYKE